MGYKTARNKALTGMTRLITSTYKGNKWSTPDGYFAINLDLYDGYKPRKYQEYPESQANLELIIDNLKPGELLTGFETDIQHDNQPPLIDCYAGDAAARIQQRYLDLFMAIYPKCKLYITGEHEPVQVKNDGELVGLIMPTRR